MIPPKGPSVLTNTINSIKTLLLSITMLLGAAPVYSEIANNHIVYIGAFGDEDYIASLVREALISTEKSHGEFVLSTLPPVSTKKRASMIYTKPNMKRLAFTTEVKELTANGDVRVLPVPLMKGIVGYRVCFSTPELSNTLNTITTVAPLREYTFGVGKNWLDKLILDFNELKNIEVGYEFMVDEQINSLYEMTARGRVDILCRGVNEVLREFDRHPAIFSLVLNQSFALYYDLPFFLFMHKDNTALYERLMKGFNTIQENGVFDRIWEKEFKKSVDFVNLNKRLVINLKREDVGIPRAQYERFLYTPR